MFWPNIDKSRRIKLKLPNHALNYLLCEIVKFTGLICTWRERNDQQNWEIQAIALENCVCSLINIFLSDSLLSCFLAPVYSWTYNFNCFLSWSIQMGSEKLWSFQTTSVGRTILIIFYSIGSSWRKSPEEIYLKLSNNFPISNIFSNFLLQLSNDFPISNISNLLTPAR